MLITVAMCSYCWAGRIIVAPYRVRLPMTWRKPRCLKWCHGQVTAVSKGRTWLERCEPSQELDRCLPRPWFQRYLWKKDLQRHACYLYVAFYFLNSLVLWYVRCCHFIWQLHWYLLDNSVSGRCEGWGLPQGMAGQDLAARACPTPAREHPAPP